MPRALTADIHADERLLFFPTIGRLEASSRSWELPIHGWVFRPEDDSLRRAAAMRVLRRWIGLEPTGSEAALFDRRLRAFLVDNQPDKVVAIRLGGAPYKLPPSMADGHFAGLVRLPQDAASLLLDRAGDTGDGNADTDHTITFDALLPAADRRSCGGRVHLIGDEGLSVISDIDDTIKITHVNDRGALLRQTFLRPFEPVLGMAALYRRWRSAGASFHYVSRSPWQLYPALSEFFVENGFPSGTVHLRKFRWKNAGTLLPDGDGMKKQREVEAVLAWLPRREFILIGDSGEHDPEIYGDLARRCPRVRAVFIRNVTGENRNGSRLQRALADVADDRWHLFDRPEELPATV